GTLVAPTIKLDSYRSGGTVPRLQHVDGPAAAQLLRQLAPQVEERFALAVNVTEANLRRLRQTTEKGAQAGRAHRAHADEADPLPGKSAAGFRQDAADGQHDGGRRGRVAGRDPWGVLTGDGLLQGQTVARGGRQQSRQ